MELVPLDPEVSERGGGQAAAAGQPGSAPGRGGGRPAASLQAPGGPECPPVPSPLSGSTPLCSGCECAGDGSAGRSVPPCGSQEREPPRGVEI